VWWRPHLHRHQWIAPEYIRTLDSTGVQGDWDSHLTLTSSNN
jgi:hypothetical protein